MSELKLLGFSAWQLWIKCVATVTDCCFQELQSNRTEIILF